MEGFHPSFLMQISRLITQLLEIDSDALVSDGVRAEWRRIFANLKDYCVLHEFSASGATLARLLDLLNREKPIKGRELGASAKELRGRLEDELEARTFLALSMKEAQEYERPRVGWEDVLVGFPGIVDEVEEAGKCLALGRNTACVFHLMRIMECGLQAFGGTLNDPSLDPRRNPSWDAILEKCDRELAKRRRERPAEWNANDRFFAAATANLRAVKEAWRNPTMHIDRSYDGEQAREIYLLTRVFMRHLAGGLPQPAGGEE